MQYFFILGKNQALSRAELTSVFGSGNLEFANNVALLKSDQELDAPGVISRLGGTIKIGVIKDKGYTNNKKEIQKKVIDLISSRGEKAGGKFKFGFSQYHKKPIIDPKKTGMDAKRALKEKGVNSRMVTSKEKTLSSVVVEQNKLTAKGMEIVLIKRENEVLIGKTLAVQPFKELSGRDYGRPQRDDHSGMLPPKLAQIMINLTGVKPGEQTLLLDPFCGSGTMITEAALMGWKNLIGIDTSEKAIEDASKNMEWILEKHKTDQLNWNFDTGDAKQVSDKLKPHSVDAIVTEPYLGPQREKIDTKQLIPKLEELYSSALQNWQKVLNRDGRIVMIWPFFAFNHKGVKPDIQGLEIVPPINANKKEASELTSRNTIIYGRPHQKVWREIVILKKS